MAQELFLPRWAEILTILSWLEPKDRYYQRLLRYTQAASSYVREVLQALEDLGFLEVKQTGKRLVLTAKGNQLAFHLAESATLLGKRPPMGPVWG